jgi:hypothetical protein
VPINDEWVKKLWYKYTMKIYSAIEKNEIMPFTRKRIELEIMLSEIRQSLIDKYLVFSLIFPYREYRGGDRT